MKPTIRMIRRKILLIIASVAIFLLSTYIFNTWSFILWEQPSFEINVNQQVLVNSKNIDLRKYKILQEEEDQSLGYIMFKDFLVLNKELESAKILEKKNIDKAKFIQKLKRKYDAMVGLIYNETKKENHMNTLIDIPNRHNTNNKVYSGETIENQRTTTFFSETRTRWHDSEATRKRTKFSKKYFETFPSMVVLESILKHEKTHLIEEPFPLAFSHMLHKDVAIFETFLALYFRPNNFHCVHVDYKAPDSVRNDVEDLVRCYKSKSNQGEIFVLPKNESIDVQWGEMSVLDADMKCQSELLKLNKERNTKFQWKYVSSVAGSELPIVTYSTFHNKISTNLKNEQSSVESFDTPELNLWRFDRKRKYETSVIENGIEEFSYKVPFDISNPGEKNFSRELEFKVFKGLKNVILSYRDTEFLINHPFSRQLYDWFKETDFPEEHFLPTLIRISVDPNTLMIHQNQSATFLYQDSGGLTYTTGDTLHGLCPRFTQWMERYDCINSIGCFGECSNSICNLHTLDLYKISDQTTDCLIANKFNLEVDPTAVAFQFFNVLKDTIDDLNKFEDWFVVFDKIAKMKFI